MKTLARETRREVAMSFIEPLEVRISPALITATWLGGDGNWNDPSQWSTGVVPNNGGGNDFHVVLDVPGTVTITVPGSINIHSLSNAEHLNIVGSFGSPTYFHLTGGGVLNNTGTIQLFSDGNDPNRSQIIFDNTTSVTGAGDILLTDYPMLSAAPNAHVTLGGGQKIHGAGYVNIPVLNNAAFIDADVAGSFLSVTATGVNTNTLVASAGLLRLNNSHFDNSLGTLRAEGGTVEVTNSSLPGGEWLATNNPASHLMLIGNVGADGANWQASGAGNFQVSRTTCTLSGDVTFGGGNFSLVGDFYAPMYFHYAGGKFTNNGTISITSDNNDPNRALFAVDAHATIDGVGDVKLINTPLVSTAAGATLTLEAGQTLHGQGVIIGSYVNHGTIEADATTGPLQLNGAIINNPDGIIGAHGGQLAVNNGTRILDGTLTVTDNPASVIDFTGTIGVEGTTWVGEGAGRFRVNYGTTATLNGRVHLAAGRFDILGHYGAPTYLHLGGGTWTNDGLIHLLSDNNDPNRSQIHLNENITLNGDGVLLLEHTPMISGEAGRQLTVGADQVIHGSGVINVPLLANAGTIMADAADETLTISSAGANSGLMSATAGTLRFAGANLTNTGATVSADGATVSLANCTITGGDVLATDNTASRVFLEGTVNADGTTWTANGAGEFQVAYTTATLNGNVHLASGRLGLIGDFGRPIYFNLGGGTFTNDGRIELVSDYNSPDRAQLHLNADARFAGVGEIKLIGAPRISGEPGTRLTLDTGQTLHGCGIVNVPRLDTAGTIVSDVTNQTLVVTSTGANTGLMHASAGTLQINSSNFTNANATVRADGGIVELANSTVTGGAFIATAGAASRMRFVGNVNAGGTTWTASSPGEFQVAYTTTTLSGDVTLSGGKFSLLGAFHAPMYFHYAGGTFTNNGTIELLSDNNDPNRGQFYVDADATLAGAGDLKMIGTPLLTTAPTAALTIGVGQKVHGYGIVTGNLVNQGTIEADAGANPVQLNAATITNPGGTVRANAGRLAISQGTTITGGALAVTDDLASVIDFSGTIGVDGTTWTGAGAGRFRVNYGTSTTVNGSVHLAAGEFDVLGSYPAPSYLNLGGGTWTNDGLIRLVSDNNAPNRSQIHLIDHVTLDGGGVLLLEHTPMISGEAGKQLTIGTDQLVHGSGVINVPLLVNTSAITADAANETLTISSTGTNANLMNATAGTLRLEGANLTNTGATIRAEGGAVVLVNSMIAGGNLLVTDDAASLMDFYGTIEVGGTMWSGAGLGRFRVPYTTATLQGLFYLAAGEFDVLGNFGAPARLNLAGTAMLNDGTIRLVSDNQDPNRSMIYFENSMLLDGSGDLQLVGTPMISSAPGTQLNIGTGQRVHGVGYLSGPALLNYGRIIADEPGLGLIIQSDVTNRGALAAFGGMLTLTGQLNLDLSGALGTDATGLIVITHDLVGNTVGYQRVGGDANVRMDGSGPLQFVEVMDRDLGWTDTGFAGGLGYRVFTLNGASVKLQDAEENVPLNDAIYLDELNVPAGSTLDLNGQHIYVRMANIAGTVIGDAGAPASSITALPANWLGSDLLVEWSGQDDAGGSGLACFDIYVSTNGGSFEVWLRNTTDTSATYPALDGTTYAFYSVARDNIGYVEPAPMVPDATVEIHYLGIDSTPALQVNENTGYLYQATSNVGQLPGVSLTWSLVATPPELHLGLDGVIQGAFDNTGVGDHTVTVRVDDNQGHHAEQTFTLNVANVAGIFTAQTPGAAMLGAPYLFDLDSTDEGHGAVTYSIANGPAWLHIDPAAGLLHGTPGPQDLGTPGVTVGVDDGHGGTDAMTFALDVQGQHLVLDPALKQTKVTFTDANGDTVSVALSGKTGRVDLYRAIAPDGTGHYLNTTTGDLFAIVLDGTGLKNTISLTAKANKKLHLGDGYSSFGGLTGDGSLAKLSAAKFDLIGDGIALPTGTIASLALHDVKNGADLTLGGTLATRGVTFTAHDLSAGVSTTVANHLRLLKATAWTDGTLTAPSGGTVSIAGDLAANLDLPGPLGTLSVGRLLGGALHAATLGSLTVRGAADFDLTLTDALAKNTLGRAKITGDLTDSTWDVAAKIASITVSGTVRDSVVRAGGDIASLTVGASLGSDFAAGTDLATLLIHRHATTAPTGTIKTFTVKGWKVPRGQTPPRFFTDSNVSAKIGTMKLLDYEEPAALWAPTDGVKKVICSDKVFHTPDYNWVFPKASQPTPDFIHFL